MRRYCKGVSAATWLLFVLMEIPLCLTPGPAVLFVFAHGLRYGGPKSLWANLGILSGNIFYFAISATGLGVLIRTSHEAFVIVKWAGAAYLVFAGLRMMWSGAGVAPAFEGAPEAHTTPGLIMLRRGVVLQLANPKALIFFTAFLPQFIDPQRSIVLQMTILGVTSTVLEFFILAGYGYLAARVASWTRTPRTARVLNWIAGGMLVTVGAGLALTSEN